MFMSKAQREIERKLRILQHAAETGHVAKTCRYFGAGRSSFYRWREAHRKHGDAGLVNRPSIPKWHANRTPAEIEEKVIAETRVRYGYPRSIRVDQGPEFVSRELDLWAYMNGVVLDFSRPGKPTDNGFIESFNGKIRAECVDQNWFLSLADARVKCEASLTISPSSNDTTSAATRCMSIPIIRTVPSIVGHEQGASGQHDKYGSALAAHPGES